MKKKIIIATTVVILLIFVCGIYYFNDYYHADATVGQYMNGSKNISVVSTDNALFIDAPGNDTAVIFYPGAKVEYTSYLPMFFQLSNDYNIDCFLVKMPLNMALFGANTADGIIKNTSYEHYFLAGHSLGGVMASMYVNDTNEGDGLILLNSYAANYIQKPILSIYASNDNILDMAEYNDSRHNMENLTEVVIKGGNHAQMGNYGIQSGDGVAEISPQEQQNQTVDAMGSFILNITKS